MFDRLTPEMWQLMAVLSTGGFLACFTTTGLLLWRHGRQHFEWLLKRIDEIHGPGQRRSGSETPIRK